MTGLAATLQALLFLSSEPVPVKDLADAVGADPSDVEEALGELRHKLDGHGIVLRELAGHGIGHTIHEPPTVPNFGAAGLGEPLTEGLVITLEPIVAAATRSTRRLRDGWTVATADGGRSAHVEHTIVVGRGRPLILTA